MPIVGSPEPIAALNRVCITETALPWEAREALVDIRAYCPGVVCNEGICPYLRTRVADKLNRAQESLPPGYRLKVGTALRTLSMQRHGWDSYFQKMRTEHPKWPLSALRRATNKYHAPYDQKAPPGHCTGGAVDVGLLDPDGNALDMIAPTQGWEAVDTFTTKISPESKANRMLMVEAMLGAGFSNCRDEYWHYSWGDSGWAVRVGESECPYGWTYAPVALETDYATACADNLHMHTARDISGKVMYAQGRCAIPPDADKTSEGHSRFSVGLYWAKDVSVTLTVMLPPDAQEALPLWIGDGKEAWDSVTAELESGKMRLRVLPAWDRAILTTQLPAPKPAE